MNNDRDWPFGIFPVGSIGDIGKVNQTILEVYVCGICGTPVIDAVSDDTNRQKHATWHSKVVEVEE